ncbi:MAG: hypothetical protein GKR89_35705 [Candidatus Latescibacteria bacterium]|nr:hypothetical protein [Candidatus Latescibacterota bacterium]
MRYFLIFLLGFGLAEAGAQEQVGDAEVVWYGYFKFDMAHDSAVSSNGNYILYVRPQGKTTSTLNITARQTRLGARIQRGQMRGKVEVDFYGVSPENKNALLLRQAYVAVPLGPLWLEAGQSIDIIGPLVPSTLNYSVVRGAGNVGYRHPQVKLYYRGGTFFAGGSLSRNISGDLDGDTIVDGSASGVPAVQGRVACTVRSGDAELTVGGWSHYGRCNCPSQSQSYSNWSIGGDGRFAWRGLALLGEWYSGANMGQYGGAIYNSDQLGGLHSTGAWVNMQYRLAWPLRLSVGAGVDRVRTAGLQGLEQARRRNAVLFANGRYRILPGVWAGFEVSQWRTRYANPSPGTQAVSEDWRLQWSLKGDF